MTTPLPSVEQRLAQLEILERQIPAALQSAGQAILELSKENARLKQVENHTSCFLKTLEEVESGISKHITYLTQVSTGQAHEGSCYAALKDIQMASHRVEHVRSRLCELVNEQRLYQHSAAPGGAAQPQ